MPRTLLSCLLLLGLGLTHSSAQEGAIVINKGRVNIALGGFSGPNADQVRSILANDLTLSSAFAITPASEAAFTASAITSASGISGTVTGADGRTALSGNYNGDVRAATHAFADAIVEKLTTQKGIASSKLVFISAESGHKEVYLMDIDGANVRPLTKDASTSIGPKLSPDGNRIAYTSYKGGYPDVWLIDLTAKKRFNLTKDFPGTNQSPSFSPDGSTLALILSKDGNTDLYTMPADGGTANRLTRTRGTESTPTWSPDGSTLAFISDDRGSPQVYLIPSAGGQLQRINTSSTYTTETDWSPDGKKLAFSVRVAGGNQIAMTVLPGGEPKVLTTSGNNESPSWTRNSRHLVYARAGALYLLDSITRESVQLKNGIGKASEPNCSR
ncbi:MAG: biopolymer transporter Tol [Candidatus Methylacidiphilales bacterium]|nr:biopolymer transporter Tol [Candidatus Methylacidiphilales bacterium]